MTTNRVDRRSVQMPHMVWVASSVAAGLMIGAAYTIAPLLVWAVVAAAVLVRIGRHGLPEAEQRLLTATLAAAFVMRLLALGGLLVAGAVRHADPALGAMLTGDEAYVLGRALRARDILLGVAVSKFDYVVAFDDYGRNSWVSIVTWIQVMFGPAPYGTRMLNAVVFTSGSLLLFHEARRAFGWLPAHLALVLMLFYPTMFVWSISLLKEPLYLLGTALVLVSALRLLRAPVWSARAWPAVSMLVGLAIIADLRPGAIVVAASGLATGIALRESTRTAARCLSVVALLAVAIAALVTVPALQRRAIAALETTAKQQSGHVFTVGHAYKTLDEGFYMTPQPPLISNITLTADQAARYVVRSAVSFVMMPVPWQIASTRELAYLPEQLVWYAMLLFAPFGVAAGWRRDPLTTALLAGWIVPTAAGLALTSGNVGTMLRLRGVLIPYLSVLTALGVCHVLERLAAARPHPRLRDRLA